MAGWANRVLSFEKHEWGSKVVTQLSEYLRAKDPSLKGYSHRNIYNMVNCYETNSSPEFAGLFQGLSLPQIVQTASAQTSAETIVQPETLNMIERLSEEPIQQIQGLRENHSTSARVRRKVP